MIVLFNDTGEFLDEMKERGPNVDRVLRVVVRRYAAPSGPSWTVKVIATYLRRITEDAMVQTVRLDHRVGEIPLVRIDPAVERIVGEALEDTVRRIEKAARDEGLIVAGGQYLPNGPKGGE